MTGISEDSAALRISDADRNGTLRRLHNAVALGSLKRQGEWIVPTRLALVRRMGSVDLDLTRARFAGPMVVVELDMKLSGVEVRLPDGASASIDDVEVIVGSARDHRRDAPAEGRPHVVFTGKVVCGSVDIRGPRKSWLGRDRR